MQSLLLATIFLGLACSAYSFSNPAFVPAMNYISSGGTFGRQGNSELLFQKMRSPIRRPQAGVRNLDSNLAEGSNRGGLPRRNLHSNPLTTLQATQLAVPPLESTRAIPMLRNREHESFDEVKRPVDVQAWVSEDKSTCIFSLDGEAEGSLLYTLENGFYRFQAYLVYPDGDSSGDFSSFAGSFSRATILKPPLFLFDDPLPRCSARLLGIFARRFLSHFHVHEIKRAREILMEPLRAGEKALRPGDKLVLSHSYVTRMEMFVTEDSHLQTTRLVSVHPTEHFDEHGNMVPREVDWKVESPGKEFQDRIFGACGAVLTKRKLRQLLSLQLGMINKPRNSELIVAGIAACYKGKGSTYNPILKQMECALRRCVLDRLRTSLARVSHFARRLVKPAARAVLTLALRMAIAVRATSGAFPVHQM